MWQHTASRELKGLQAMLAAAGNQRGAHPCGRGPVTSHIPQRHCTACQLRLTTDSTAGTQIRQITRMRVLGHHSKDLAALGSEACSSSRAAVVPPATRSPRVQLPGPRRLVVSNVIAPLKEEQQVASKPSSSTEKSRNLLDPAAVGDLLVSTWRALPLGGGGQAAEVSKGSVS
jgi:hypothetical protein